MISQIESVAQASAMPTTDGTIDVPVTAATQARFTAGGQTFTAIQTGGSVIFQGPSSTTTVNSKSAAVLAGQTVSLLTGASVFVVNGKTVSPLASSPTSANQAIVTSNGYTYTASRKGSSVVLVDASSTATVRDGAIATFGSQTLSVAANGRSIVVDGSSIVELSAASTGLIGDYIHSGLNVATTTSTRHSGATASGSATASRSPEVYVGSGSRIEISLLTWACLLGCVLLI